MGRPSVPAIVGPTGVGKSAVALAIAEELHGEILSMDSMQLYRGLDIGTAKPTQAERALVPHHLIDLVEPRESFTVADYRREAFHAIEDVLQRGKRPILVGGTGLYLDALRYELSLGVTGGDAALRASLHALAEEEDGARRLYAMLQEANPARAAELHPHDVRRVIRALEISAGGGSAGPEERREGPYHILVYGVTLPRETLYSLIDERVDRMLQAGLEQEVRGLVARNALPEEGGAAQAIGYKELAAYFRGEIDYEEAVRLIKRNSRRYAKRQWTWFQREQGIRWFDRAAHESLQEMADAMRAAIQMDCEKGEAT